MGLFGSKCSSALVEGCYTTVQVPCKKIVKNIGLVEYNQKGITGDIPKCCESIFKSLLETAKEKGGNAVINVQLTTGSYQQQGSGWIVSYVIAYGDAVILE